MADVLPEGADAAPPPPGPELFASFDAAGVPVSAWRWPDTGFSVVLAQAPGPVTHAIFIVATEDASDDGLPHTLEHLVFLGSRTFPFKGVLDMAANRLFARGTNAWTATDHTAYTASHAGADGLLALLPCFADHVLFPTLTESGFVTEVHHVDGEGNDAGVVYCEMEARERTGSSVSSYALFRLLYPGSGFAAETGGRLAELRGSTTHAKVVAYHRRFYRPSGVRLLVAGAVDPARLLAALEPVQASIRANIALDHQAAAAAAAPPPPRAWSAPPAPFLSPADAAVEFPADDEATGVVRLGWRSFPAGPGHAYQRSALEALLSYLTETSGSELQQALIERPAPALAASVYARSEEWDPGCVVLTLDGVPTGALAAARDAAAAALAAFAGGGGGPECDGDGGDAAAVVDARRMATALRRRALDARDAAESRPEDAILASIPAFLYPGGPAAAEAEEGLRSALAGELGRLARLGAEPPAFWRALARSALVDPPRAAVLARPSRSAAAAAAAEAAAWVAATRAALGEAGLAGRAAALAAACAANDAPPPPGTVEAFAVPPAAGIALHAVAPLRSAAFPPAARPAGCGGGGGGDEPPPPLPPPPSSRHLAATAASCAALAGGAACCRPPSTRGSPTSTPSRASASSPARRTSGCASASAAAPAGTTCSAAGHAGPPLPAALAATPEYTASSPSRTRQFRWRKRRSAPGPHNDPSAFSGPAAWARAIAAAAADVRTAGLALPSASASGAASACHASLSGSSSAPSCGREGASDGRHIM